MKSTTSLSFVVASLLASIANVAAAPELVTIFNPEIGLEPTASTSAASAASDIGISGIASGVDGNGHTTYIISASEVGVGTLVAGESYISVALEFTPDSGSPDPTFTEKFECSAIDATNGKCVLNMPTSSGSGFTEVPVTSTIPYGKAVFDVTATASQAASATGSAGGNQSKPNSAGAGPWIGISAVFSSAVLSGLGFLYLII